MIIKFLQNFRDSNTTIIVAMNILETQISIIVEESYTESYSKRISHKFRSRHMII